MQQQQRTTHFSYQHKNHRQYNEYSERRQLLHSPRPVIVKKGSFAYRIVCHVSIIGDLIGSSGSIIKVLGQDTSCRIHCEQQVLGSDHGVILITGPGLPERSIELKLEAGKEKDGEMYMVSSSQEAVVRVLEKVWEVQEKMGSREFKAKRYCGLLASSAQIMAVLGKGGRNINWMTKESGARIWILRPQHWDCEDDELIQITGSALSAKKALIAVTECLQGFPPTCENQPPLNRTINRNSYWNCRDPLEELFPHLGLVLPPMTNNASNPHLSQANAGINKWQDTKCKKQKVELRLLCYNEAAGSIIGTGGSTVKALENKTGASIRFSSLMKVSGVRIVTISAFENLESAYSASQNGIVLVFALSVEHEIQTWGPSNPLRYINATARLLVAVDTASCLNGKNDEELSSIAQVTGADICILAGDQIPDFASASDVVVQISGEYRSVQKAMLRVTSKLRDSLLSCKLPKEVTVRTPFGPEMKALSTGAKRKEQLDFGSPPPLLPHIAQSVHTTALADNMISQTASEVGLEFVRSLNHLLPEDILDEVGGRVRKDLYNVNKQTTSGCGNVPPGLLLPHELGRSHKVESLDSARHLSTNERHLENGRHKYDITTNTIVEIVIPEPIFGSVYGRDGSNLARLTQISGAKVEVHVPCWGKNEGKVVISGTDDQTRIGKSMVHAFIHSGK